MVSTLRGSIEMLEGMGFLNVVLPFLFVFVIIYALLEKTKVFGLNEKGKTKKNLNSMTAFLIGFIFISFMSQVDSLITYLQYIGMFLIFLMGLFYLFALFRFEVPLVKKGSYIPIVLFLVSIFGFLYAMGFLNDLEYGWIYDLLFNPVTILIVFFFGIVWFISSGEVSKPSSNNTSQSSNKPSSSYKEPDFDAMKKDMANKNSESSDSKSDVPDYDGLMNELKSRSRN